MDEEIKALCEEFKFVIDLEASDERVIYLRFQDGRGYRAQHPGALVVARIFGTETKHLTFDCLEYFIKNCLTPIAGTTAKTLTADNMDTDETLNLWLPFAWRFLRRSSKLVTK